MVGRDRRSSVFVHHSLYFAHPVKTTRLVKSSLCPDCHPFSTMLLRTIVLLLFCVSVGMCATLVHYQTPANEEDAAAVIDSAAAAVSVDAAQEAPADDSPAAEEPAAHSVFVDTSADEPEVNVSHGARAEEPGTNTDRPAGDTPALDDSTSEIVTQKQPSSSSSLEEGNDIRPVQTSQSLNRPLAREESSWSLNSIRNSFQTVHGYFDSLVELVGGHDGVCQYRCRYGKNESFALKYCTVMK